MQLTEFTQSDGPSQRIQGSAELSFRTHILDFIIIRLLNITKHSQGEDRLTLPSLMDKLQAWPFKVPKHFVNMLHVHDHDTVHIIKTLLCSHFNVQGFIFNFQVFITQIYGLLKFYSIDHAHQRLSGCLIYVIRLN